MMKQLTNEKRKTAQKKTTICRSNSIKLFEKQTNEQKRFLLTKFLLTEADIKFNEDLMIDDIITINDVMM